MKLFSIGFLFRYQIPYVETSAVTGHGLDAGINALLRLVMPSIESQMQNGLRTRRFTIYSFFKHSLNVFSS